MSTIERAAELLRSLTEAPKKPSAAEVAARAELDPIERAAGELGGRRGPAPAPGPGRGSASSTNPILAVDRERLRAQGLIVPDGERTAVTESFRRLKRQILANVGTPRTDAPSPNLVMITSALPGEGKSFCAINLAISLALEMDRTVLLVDADVARASIPRVLGLQPGKGLMDALLDPRIRLADLLWKTDIGGLTLLPAGAQHRHATELIASQAMHALLRDLAAHDPDRVVVFDSPPLLAASEAGALASQMGQIVVVVEAGKTSEAALKEALSRVEASRVVGLVLNKAKGASLEYGYDAYG
jgi:exopolysaccharide/PEP-CTERM locus tyrosine autokinase